MQKKRQYRRLEYQKKYNFIDNWLNRFNLLNSKLGEILFKPSKSFFSRINFIIIIILVSLSIMIYRNQFQIGFNNVLLNNNYIKKVIIPAKRGDIISSDGQSLASSIVQTDLLASNSLKLASSPNLLDIYSKILKVSISDLQTRLIGDSATPILAENISQSTINQIFSESALINTYTLKQNQIRIHQTGIEGLASILGYLGLPETLTDNNQPLGITGLELQYQDYLAGVNGYQQLLTNSNGSTQKQLNDVEPSEGFNLQTTINYQLQLKLEEVIRNWSAKAKESGGSGRAVMIVSNPQNGNILALANLPGYDLNAFSRSDNDKINSYLQDPNLPLLNRAYSGLYPSGSIIKPIYALLGLNLGLIDSNTTINDQGKIVVTNQFNSDLSEIFYGYNRNGLGIVNVVDAIAKSSDIFFYYLAGGGDGHRGIGASKMLEFLHFLGIDKPTGISSNETVPTLPIVDERWTLGDSYNLGIGQGNFLTTPIQMLRMVNGLANNGIIEPLNIINNITNVDGNEVIKINNKENKVEIPSENLNIVLSGMRKMVGFLDFDQYLGVTSGGKTGTAETVTARQPSDTITVKPHSWYIGFAPFEDPEISVVALFEQSGEGAFFAAPATREFMQYYFNNFKK